MLRIRDASVTFPAFDGQDVVINGAIDVFNQCFSATSCVALVNFWRSLSNLTINVANPAGCYTGQFWAVSQAAPMRRTHVIGNGQNITLMDYCTSPIQLGTSKTLI